MRYLFLVQGEGRGHMTQAIVLHNLLTANGHQVVFTLIGKSARRNIPTYFTDALGPEVKSIHSPNFVLDKDNKSLNLPKSITHNAMRLGSIRQSLQTIHRTVKKYEPDVLINFYDFLGGLYFRFYRPSSVKHCCIGRQFLTRHPNFPFIQGRKTERKLYLLNNQITAQACDKFLALSFRPYHPMCIGNLVVIPPLIKPEIRKLTPVKEDFLLCYLVNDGYAEDIISWHHQHQGETIHCFWDRKNITDLYCPHPNLIFHKINGPLFTDLMRRCKAYITTAGFESVCEALYLQKPVLMVPVAGQYEQACNALDAEKSGAGITANRFEIDQLMDFLPFYKHDNEFRAWADKSEHLVLDHLTNF